MEKAMTIIRIIILVVGIFAFWSFVDMHRLLTPSIFFLMQIGFAAIIVIYGLVFKKIPNKAHGAIGIICAIPIVFVLFLGIYGRTSNANYNEDVIIVLGAGVVGESVTRPLANRLNTAFYFWQDNPDAYIIVTGGVGNRATISEAEAMSRFLVRRGVPREQILLEEYSTSTYENLRFAMDILEEHFEGEFTGVVVTNDFHIYRAVHTARRIGMDVTRLGADTDWYAWQLDYVREMLAVVNAWVFG